METSDRAKFVKEYGELLAKYAVRNNVQSLDYEYVEEYTEIVTINYTNGHKKKINISGDSIIAITHDVYRALL